MDTKKKFYLKPALFESLKGYNGKMLANDLMSGLLVAIIALPLSIALGIQSGATLQQGIITAVVAGFFISFMGGSKVQIGGPTAAFVAIIVGYIADPEIGFLGLQIATLLAGLLMILFGVGRAGALIKFIPYPIVVGFTSGIGVTLMLGQLKDFLGIRIVGASGHELFEKMGALFSNISTINLATVLIGVFTLAVILVLKKVNKKIPGAFIAIVLATAITSIIGAYVPERWGIATIGSSFGEIKSEISFIDFSGFASLKFAKLIVPAIVIAFLASIESLLSATVADGMTGDRHNSNAELCAQGVANIASACFCGLPATGAIARTAANIKNGGKTPIAGITHSLVLLIMFFALMPIMKFIPMTSLAVVLMVVAFSMSNFKLFFRLATFGVKDTLILVVSFVLTVVKDLVWGVVGGLALTAVLMIAEIVVRSKIVKVEGEDLLEYAGFYDKSEGEFVAFRVFPNLCFKSVDRLIKNCSSESADLIIIDVRDVKKLDTTALERLSRYRQELESGGRNLEIYTPNAKVEDDCKKAFKHIGGKH